MAVTNNLKKQVDLPVWEWCRFTPIVSAAAITLCSDESSGGRYIYYIGATCYRYDTWTDGWQQIATPPVVPATVGATRYTVYGGYRGGVISASATSALITIAGLQGLKIVGKTIRITSGTGAGQQRTIVSCTDAIIAEHGVATAVSAATIQDSQTIPKKWKINQWSRYQCRLTFGTGQSQVRKILYNDSNMLYFSDPNWQAYDSWNNSPWSATLPFYLPTANTNYYIEYHIATIDTPWTTIPDSTSRYVILSGGIWLLTTRTAALGSAQLQYYDVLSDTWITKTCPGYLFPVAAGTDVTIERTGEISGTFTSGRVTNYDTSTRRVEDASALYVNDRYANYQIRIVNPSTGIEIRRRIVGNTSTNMFIEKYPDVSIDINNATYSIYGDTNAIWIAGNAISSIYKYIVEEDIWTTGQNYDSGVVKNLSFGKTGRMGYASAYASVNASSLTGVNSSPTWSGTGYRIGDICSVSVGYANVISSTAKIRVTSVNPSNGSVSGLELYACGSTGSYFIMANCSTANIIPAAGGGSGLIVSCTSVGTTAFITTVMAHDFIVGDNVWCTGASVGAWNVSFGIVACDSSIGFYIYCPSGGTITPPYNASTNSTTAIVDSEKNWTPNEHAGKQTIVTTFGVIPATTQIRKIVSNTPTTLNLFGALTTAPVSGTSRYVISDLNFFGRDDQYRIITQGSSGWASWGNPSTLVDNTKAWIPGQWATYKFKVVCGTGYDKGEIAILWNDASSLTFAATAAGFSPDTTTKYKIQDSYGSITTGGSATVLVDANKYWAVNQWVGKSIRLTVPGAAITQYDVVIASNTSNNITYATTTTLNDVSTVYTILAPPVRATGIQAMWNYGSTDTSTKGNYIFVPRGGTTAALGSNLIDKYDITQDKWNISLQTNPMTELETAGSQWTYDGKDKIYWTPSGAQASRVFAIDINTLVVDPAGIHPYANSTFLQGNRMEIITTSDGLLYLYLIRSSGAEMFRTLLWWNS